MVFKARRYDILLSFKAKHTLDYLVCGGIPPSLARSLVRQEPALKKPYKRALRECRANKSLFACYFGLSGSDNTRGGWANK